MCTSFIKVGLRILFPKKDLFQRYDVPESKTFDINLMITLLRNLTSTTPPFGGFDNLPPSNEITPCSDLARIKYYRNNLAHLDDGKVGRTEFNIAWDNISSAIDRLGGQQMKQECDDLKTKPLDQINQEIMRDIKRSNDEIRELKKSLSILMLSHGKIKESHEALQEHQIEVKKAHELLQKDHAKVKESHQLLQKDHAYMTRELQIMKSSQQDTVPWNTRGRITDKLQAWKDNNEKMFINTRAAEHVLRCLNENSCVTITGSFGVGKTAILRHTALQLAKEEYDVLLVTDPSDIVNFYNPNRKTLFVVDDLFGNLSVVQSDIKSWEPVMKEMEMILEIKQTKIIVACRFQVYKDKMFEQLSAFKSCVCDLSSDEICLSITEKESIAKLYLKTEASQITEYYNLYDCFPLLCKLYYDHPTPDVRDFFQNPFSVYEAEINNLLKKGHCDKYCALAICVIFNNKLKEETLAVEVNEETRIAIESTCEACRLDTGTSRIILKDVLDTLTETFIKKEHNIYKFSHVKVFHFCAYFYGQVILRCVIKNGNSCLIGERLVLERECATDAFIIIIPPEYHEMYIKRMIDDWSKGNMQDVFSNINMNIPLFRQKLLFYLNKLDTSYQRKLAHVCAMLKQSEKKFWDDDDDHTVLLKCCRIGDFSLVQWCCNIRVDVNKSTYYGHTAVMNACEHGHTDIAKLLLDNGADYNKYDRRGQTPLIKASGHGHLNIVKMLLNREVDCNKCDSWGRSPLMMASDNGRTEIAELLLDSGADCYKCDHWGRSALIMACEHGHTEIVKILLDRRVDYNKCNNGGQSPVMKACEYGYTEILRMLLDEGADYNICPYWRYSPVIKACDYGRTEILKLLLDRGVYYNDYDGVSPLMHGIDNGHIEIVKILLEIGADYNSRDRLGKSPVLKACEHGYTEIVKMLLDNGAECNTCDKNENFPVMTACEHGYAEIVKLLLDNAADCNIRDEYHVSPLMKARSKDHTQIVQLLLDNGAH